MSVIVTDTGFGQETWHGTFDQLDTGTPTTSAVYLRSDADPETLHNRLTDLDMIRVDFPNFADGRGFTLAQRLRQMGYTGRLRATGHVIADQYAMARRAGFDEVEISDDLAARQPEHQWLARANWQAHDYQSRLRKRA